VRKNERATFARRSREQQIRQQRCRSEAPPEDASSLDTALAEVDALHSRQTGVEMRWLDKRGEHRSALASQPLFAALGLLFITSTSACGSTGEDVTPKSSVGATGGVITGAGTGPGASSTAGSGGQGGAPQKGPPYPIVLAHGFFGFNDFAGAGFVKYFYNVKKHLEEQGEIVETPAVDPFNDSDFRGDQLAARIEELLAKTGDSKVNIIGHSQGGLDARAVAHKRPDRVASVVTIGTPHHGSVVADIALKLLGDPGAEPLIDALAKLLGGPLYDEIGNETSVTKPLHLFSKPGIGAFNAQHPDAPGVVYASIGGRSSFHGTDSDCAGDIAVPFIKAAAGELDPLDPLFTVPAVFLGGGIGKSLANDGLVGAKEAHWGEFWGCIPADHVDEVGQLFGDGPGFGNDWDHLKFYSDLVAYLRQRGL
jgi:triacylglycerol lipase